MGKQEVRIEFQAIEGDDSRIRVLTYRPELDRPVETILDVIRVRQPKKLKEQASQS